MQPNFFQFGNHIIANNQTGPHNFQTNSNNDFRGDLSNMFNNRPVFTGNVISNNNSTQIFLPNAGDVHSGVYNKTYNNDIFRVRMNLGSNSNSEGESFKQTQADSNNRKETQEQAIFTSSENALNKPADQKSKKPIKLNTNCPHGDARHYAKVRFIFNCLEYV
jgi:hypothetical protein